jgi:hypothetical protein
MTNQFWKYVGTIVVAALTIGLITEVLVSAQSGNEQGLVGSWDTVVTPRDCETGVPIPFIPPFIAVQTYNQGGTLLTSNLGAPGIATLEGHGVWEHRVGREYSVAFRILKFNPDGTYAGRDVIRDVISLDIGGNSYSSTGAVEILDPNGTLILRGCATSLATRFR